MRAVSVNLLLLLASCCVLQYCYTVSIPNPDYDLRIFGGHEINITEAPYFAQYKDPTKSYVTCGATIVHEKFVVTSAGCITKHLVVVVGSNERGKGEAYEIEKHFIHPKYHYTKDYNIVVLKLKKKLIFNDRVNKIKMADDSLVPKKGDLMEVVGFGVTENKTEPKYLLKADVPFVDLPKCRKEYESYGKYITERMFCAGEKGKGVCFGDGGGPLVYKDQFYGITSWGRLPCTKYPAVYTKMPSFRDFVDEVIKNNS